MLILALIILSLIWYNLLTSILAFNVYLFGPYSGITLIIGHSSTILSSASHYIILHTLCSSYRHLYSYVIKWSSWDEGKIWQRSKGVVLTISVELKGFIFWGQKGTQMHVRMHISDKACNIKKPHIKLDWLDNIN